MAVRKDGARLHTAANKKGCIKIDAPLAYGIQYCLVAFAFNLGGDELVALAVDVDNLD